MVEAHGKDSIVRTYVIFAVVLAIITFCEWVIFQVEDIRTQPLIMVPTLLVMSLVKFVMVAGWYMHLRFDHGILWKIFAFAGVMALCTFIVVSLCIHKGITPGF